MYESYVTCLYYTLLSEHFDTATSLECCTYALVTPWLDSNVLQQDRKGKGLVFNSQGKHTYLHTHTHTYIRMAEGY